MGYGEAETSDALENVRTKSSEKERSTGLPLPAKGSPGLSSTIHATEATTKEEAYTPTSTLLSSDSCVLPLRGPLEKTAEPPNCPLSPSCLFCPCGGSRVGEMTTEHSSHLGSGSAHTVQQKLFWTNCIHLKPALGTTCRDALQGLSLGAVIFH